MKFEVVTIKDIAKALNVSKSTVSRAFQDAYDVNPETRKQVLAYAQKVNYIANPNASGLRIGKSMCIGIAVSEIDNSYYSQVINGIESLAFEKGYSVIITQSHDILDREQANVQQLCSHSIDGLLVSLSNVSSDISYLRELNEKGLPVVLFDKVSNEMETHKVQVDNFGGAFKATEHLILQGHKKVAHITAPPYLSITKERLNGYKAALKKYEIPFDQNLVRHYDQGKDIVAEVKLALQSLFESEEKPDAIFTATERTTMICFQSLAKLLENNNLAIAGFSNNALFNSLYPKMTIVHQPAFEMGRLSAELLIQIIESKRPVRKFETKVLNTDLIVGINQ